MSDESDERYHVMRMNGMSPSGLPVPEEFAEDVCDVCGTLFKPLAGLRGAPSGCPECAAKRAEQGEAL